MILGLLLGNSSLRYGLFDGGSIVETGRIEWRDLAAAGADLSRTASGHGVTEAVAGSVRDDLLPRLEAWLPPSLLPVRLARRDFPLPITNRYGRPEEAGTDRLLNAIAAHARARGAAVAVDFGTAVSLSVVSARGEFLGGLIAPGGMTSARGLRASAPRLPEAEPAPGETFICAGTAPAVSAGTYWEVAGGVGCMLRGILREAPGSRVLATGGEAGLFAPAIPEIDEVAPDLTLEGLLLACRSR